VDQFVGLLMQKLSQPLELKPDWSASPLVGSLHGVLQWLNHSMVAGLRCPTYRLTLKMTQCMLWSADGTWSWSLRSAAATPSEVSFVSRSF
jgi:hypothetical protein